MSDKSSEWLKFLTQEREKFLEVLESAPVDTLHANPSEGAWSPHQVAEHVYRAERATLRGLEHQLDPKNERRDVGKTSRLRVAAVMTTLKAPKKYRVPEKANVWPSGMDHEEMKSNWAGFNERWKKLTNDFPDQLEAVALIKHPLAGPLTLNQCLQFLTLHSARHLKQLKRTIEAVSSQ